MAGPIVGLTQPGRATGGRGAGAWPARTDRTHPHNVLTAIERLTVTDREVLGLVAEHEVMTGQLAALCFPRPERVAGAGHRLRYLATRALLVRFPYPCTDPAGLPAGEANDAAPGGLPSRWRPAGARGSGGRGRSGKEAAESIRLTRPDIQVLFMSGYAQPILASQGRLDHDVNLIEKPFSESAIIEKAGRVLNGQFEGFRTVKPSETEQP